MIIIRVFGGLGNQLFQYAFGQFMAKKLDRNVLYDFSYFTKDRLREPSILSYNFEIEKVPYKQVKKYLPFKSFRLNSIYNKIFNSKTFCEKEAPLDLSQSVLYFHNYWQDKAYSNSVLQLTKEHFFITNNSEKLIALAEKISNTSSVSIHIRRGDYLLKENQKIFTQLPPRFFINATALLEKHTKGKLNYFVFSDDLAWAKSHLSTLKNCQFIADNEDYEDLFLMSICKHNIISNSTFSWWAATLNKNSDRIIIAPSDWFNGDLLKTEQLLFKEWIRL